MWYNYEQLFKFLAGKPRVGVCSEDGTALGFLYIEKGCSLRELRGELQGQVSDLVIGK